MLCLLLALLGPVELVPRLLHYGSLLSLDGCSDLLLVFEGPVLEETLWRNTGVGYIHFTLLPKWLMANGCEASWQWWMGMYFQGSRWRGKMLKM